MKKMTRKQKGWMITGLCLIVLFMIVGYAAFATNLTITGSATIDSTWDVRITDIKVTNVTGSATKAAEPAVIDNTKATFKTSLKSPSDSMTYEVKVENNGTISAKLKKLTINDAKNPAILFNVTGISENDVLGEHTSTTFDITVTYDPNVESQPANTISNLDVILDYVQNS